MSSKLSSVLQVLFKPSRLRTLMSINKDGYLREIGWFRAHDTKSPVDGAGNPIPWVTYSFIDFIKTRISKQHNIFEFGSGNSTFFYAEHAGAVVSVEHDKAWFEKISKKKPANSEMIYCDLQKDGDYCRMSLKLSKQFDVIIVDGRDRVNCCKQAINALTPAGVIVLDDSEREGYTKGVAFLKENGFKQLAFTGISPGLFYLKATSVFYRNGNCLDI